jgi:hypothetical protein
MKSFLDVYNHLYDHTNILLNIEQGVTCMNIRALTLNPRIVFFRSKQDLYPRDFR